MMMFSYAMLILSLTAAPTATADNATVADGRLFSFGSEGLKPLGQRARELFRSRYIDTLTFNNISDVEADDYQTLVVAIQKAPTSSNEPAAFTFRNGVQLESISVKDSAIARASMSPDRSLVAVASCNSTGCRLDGVEVDGQKNVAWSFQLPNRATAIAWNPSGSSIAYVLNGKMVYITDIKQTQETVLEGSEIGWSPSGDRLAIGRGNNLVIYDLSTKSEDVVLSRIFWKTRIVGRISWINQHSLVFNTPSGIDGYQLDCNIFDLQNRSTIIVDMGNSFCGAVRSLGR